MTIHPSLTAPRLPLNRLALKPVAKMGRNEQCWCLSGKKYKFCHLDRETQSGSNAFDQEREMLKEMRQGYCSFPGPNPESPCSSKITKAHTVQKNGGMAAISEENHVLSVKPAMKDMIATNGNPQPRRVGVNLASVFPGFCSYHDSELFKKIEGKTLQLDADTAFLFSYRAIAYEAFSKAAQKRFNTHLRDADKGMPFWKQAQIQSLLYDMQIGIEIGLRELGNWKEQFDSQLLSGPQENFHFAAFRFSRVLPIVACGAFHPEFDFEGARLQQLGQDTFPLDHITLTVTAFEESTIAIFGWIGPVDGPAHALVNSYQNVDDNRKADALLRLLFIHTDNLFLRPSWWTQLPDDQKRGLNDMTRSGSHIQARTGRELSDDRKTFLAASVIESRLG